MASDVSRLEWERCVKSFSVRSSSLPQSYPSPPFVAPWRGQSGGVPYGPPGLTGQQRRTREPSRAGPRAGKRSARPGTPPPATSAPGRGSVGVWVPASTAAPPVPTGSQGARVTPSRARRTPVPVRTQSWDGRAACLCDQEDAMPWPTTPVGSASGSHGPPTGPGAPGHTCPPRARLSPRTPLPARAPTHRTTVSSAHLRFGGVWWLSIVRSALEPDSQVVQPRGGAGKEAHTQGPAPA